MADPEHCPNCGSERPARAPQGLCPRCLLQQALDGDSLGLSHDGGPAATLIPAPGPGGASVLASIAAAIGPVPRVLLWDTDTGPETPVVRVGGDTPPRHPDPSGLGRLQILGEIARGGMGVVLKGRDTDLGRDLAIKLLLEAHRDQPELVRRFIEEAQIGGQLQHPGIVPVHELGAFADGRPFFTMKLVKGRTLAALLEARNDPAQERPRFLSVFLQVCQTVAYAHSRGVIHRDLKPSNVMVGGFGEVQVMDWGLAKVLQAGGVVDEERATRRAGIETLVQTVRSGSDADASRAGSVLGTPAYMAPQQARGEIDWLDERADVFSLGAILCEVLTGVPPYVGHSSAEVQRMAARADLEDALARLDACGAEPELLALARRCLAAELRHRPRDASEVAQAMTAYLGGVQERLKQAELARAAEEARAAEARATMAQERRARRLTVALAASVLIAGALGAAGWRRVELERIGRATALAAQVNDALREATRLREQARSAPVGELAPWTAALAAARKANDLMKLGVAPPLREQTETLLAQVAAEEHQAKAAEGDRRLLDRLVDIRSASADGPRDSGTNTAYANAFRGEGIDVTALPPAEAGAKLRSRPSAVALALATAVDHWAAVRRDDLGDTAGAGRLIEVARVADPDPWRNRLRDALAIVDRDARLAQLRMLARTTATDLPAVSLDLLGRALVEGGDLETAEGVLRRALRRHTGDAWLHLDLAGCLDARGRRQEALRHYTAARTVLPDLGRALAHALQEAGELDEAIVIYLDFALKSLSLEDLRSLREALRRRGGSAEASAAKDAVISALREAIRRNPSDAASNWLVVRLLAWEEPEDAVATFREIRGPKIDNAHAHAALADILWGVGRRDEAAAEYVLATELGPKNDIFWFFSAMTQLRLGRIDAYHRVARKMSLQFAGTNDEGQAARVAWIGLLQPEGRDDVEQAAWYAERSLELAPGQAYALFAGGLADYRRDRHESAVNRLRRCRETMRTIPPRYHTVVSAWALLVEAMASARLGRDDARETLGQAERLIEPKAAVSGWQNLAIYEILHGEAEALIVFDPIFPANPFAR